MDPTLHYRIYGEGIDEQVIIKYIKPVKLFDIHHPTTDHVWRD